MSVFIAAADESTDQQQRQKLVYGGFAASLDTWTNHFCPAWDERVLAGPPRLRALHVSEVRNERWRRKNGLTERDAMSRLDEAARIIRSTGGLVPVTIELPLAGFQGLAGRRFNAFPERKQLHRGEFAPDHYCFLGFALFQLDIIKKLYPEAQKVDFWVERNAAVTRNLEAFVVRLGPFLSELGHDELAPLVGEYQQVTKERIPAQAADYLCWHKRNRDAGTLDAGGQSRYAAIVRRGRNRPGWHHVIQEKTLQKLAVAWDRAVGS